MCSMPCQEVPSGSKLFANIKSLPLHKVWRLSYKAASVFALSDTINFKSSVKLIKPLSNALSISGDNRFHFLD